MSESPRLDHPLDLALLSAYHDDALDPAERQRVAAHLAQCATCRERLAGYATLGGAIRSDAAPSPPPTLDARVAALQRAYPPGRRTGPDPAAAPTEAQAVLPGTWPIRLGIVAVVLALIAARLVIGSRPGAAGPMVAAAYPCARAADCAITVRFTAPVDRASVEQSIRIEPAVPLTFVWPDDRTLLVRPSAPLRPSVSYTVSLRPDARPGRRVSGTPVAVRFVAAEPGTPVVVAAAVPPTFTAVSPPPSPSLLVEATASPTAAPTASSTAPATLLARVLSPSPSPTPCPLQPVRGFGTLYHAQPRVAARLGCARMPEAAVDTIVQPFEHGWLIWRADRQEVVALTSDGRWTTSSAAGTGMAPPPPGETGNRSAESWHAPPALQAALGAATAPAAPLAGAVEDFDHGTLLWTADRVIDVLYADGTWEQYPDTFVDQAATATAAAAPPSPTPISPRTPPATATAGSAPSAPACPIMPVRGFGLVYRTHPEVAAKLGCASASEIGAPATSQRFEHGLMVRRDDVRQIFVIRDSGAWAVYPDTYENGEPLADVGTPPPGRLVPIDGLGKLWRQQAGLRQALGWATAAPRAVSGAYEQFAAGTMLWTSDRIIYALYADGTWQSFEDRFVDATPTG